MSNTKFDKLSIRLYNTGSVGDCILLLFKKEGKNVFRLLIDCGGFLTADLPINKAVQNISTECDKHIDLLILTHQHLDHISGFNQARAVFDEITVDEVWMSWVEKETDEIAQLLKNKYQKKLKELQNQATTALSGLKKTATIKSKIKGINGAKALRLQNLTDAVELLDFERKSVQAAAGKLTNEGAMKYVKRKGERMEYRYPGELIKGSGSATGLKFYILGPPREKDLKHLKIEEQDDEIYLKKRAAGEQEGGDDEEQTVIENLLNPGVPLLDQCPPFKDLFIAKGTEKRKLQKEYNSEQYAWRQIEQDYTDSLGETALALTRFMNNTSLAIAIEIESTAQVILLPADAQSGNWISWHLPEISQSFTEKGGMDVKELLSKTVFYKVGHHGSENGTASKSGLKLMTNPDLVAMIPLIQNKVPSQWGGSKNFPAKNLYQKLITATNGRLLRVDDFIVNDNNAEVLRNGLSTSVRKAFTEACEKSPTYIEYNLAIK